MDYRNLKPHPLAALFPKYADADLKELTADIKTNGLQQPITLFNDQILDGVNRWEACLALNTFKPEMFNEYQGPDPVAYLISTNFRRRDLTISQRAMIADQLATMRQGERTDKNPSPDSKSVETAAKELNVSARSVGTARAVRKADPALAENVKHSDHSKQTIPPRLVLLLREVEPSATGHYNWRWPRRSRWHSVNQACATRCVALTHDGIRDKSVGPNCIVAWRHRNGGGEHQFYTGTIRDTSLPALPTIATGIDVRALVALEMPHMIKIFEARRAGKPAEEPNKDEINARLARLPDKPDENLR
jgi:hypothetical protein